MGGKIALVLSATLFTSALYAGDGDAQWTDRDRFAARADAAAAAVRLKRHPEVVASVARVAPRGMSAGPVAAPYDVIDGSDDPHLFFEFEVFDSFVNFAFPSDPRARLAYHESVEKHRTRLGLPPDMWQTLEAITAAYRDDRARERAAFLLDVSKRDAELEIVSSRLCRDRFAALNEARRVFGPAFTRFLYAAVAPGMSYVILQKPDPQLLRIAQGACE